MASLMDIASPLHERVVDELNERVAESVASPTLITAPASRIVKDGLYLVAVRDEGNAELYEHDEMQARRAGIASRTLSAVLHGELPGSRDEFALLSSVTWRCAKEMLCAPRTGVDSRGESK